MHRSTRRVFYHHDCQVTSRPADPFSSEPCATIHTPSPQTFHENYLDHESLYLVLESSDLVHEITGLVGGNRCSNDSPGYTASTSESGLAGDIDICNVLVFAQEWEVKEDRKRGGVGGEDDDLRYTSI
jgi:hypothetical protein